jgi:hypothetical protein
VRESEKEREREREREIDTFPVEGGLGPQEVVAVGMVEHHEEAHLFWASTLQQTWHKQPTCSWLPLLSEYSTKSLSRPESSLDFSYDQPRGP